MYCRYWCTTFTGNPTKYKTKHGKMYFQQSDKKIPFIFRLQRIEEGSYTGQPDC